ncbi:MAG: SMR family transporter [Candidatus Eisenbacteria bacterium]
MKNFILIFISVLIAVCAQLTMKYGISKGHLVARLSEVSTVYAYFISAFTNPFVVCGFLLYGVSSLFWLVVLGRVDLSYAYPLVSMGYVLAVLFSWLIFKEQVGAMRVVGLGIICIGVTLLSRS